MSVDYWSRHVCHIPVWYHLGLYVIASINNQQIQDHGNVLNLIQSRDLIRKEFEHHEGFILICVGSLLLSVKPL